ncbi:MAG: hypothetical protein RI885_2283 [Actinomycetota bacterium]
MKLYGRVMRIEEFATGKASITISIEAADLATYQLSGAAITIGATVTIERQVIE